MSETLESAAEKLREKLGGRELDGSVKFDVTDEGAIIISGGDVRVGEGDADVTISGSLDTFRAMFEGELAPTAAYMTGRISIDGDMSMAMKLSQVL